MNITQQLQEIGIPKQEATVYLSLLELKEAQTGRLCGHTGIASSNIYPVLKSLQKRGLVSYTVRNNIKVYYPASVERLNDIIDEKQTDLDKQRHQISELVNSLKSLETSRPMQGYKYFEGIGGVIALWKEITSNLAPNMSVFILASKVESYQKMMPYYDEFHSKRVDKGISARIILPVDDQKLASKRQKQLAEVRFCNLINDAEMGVVGNWMYLQYVVKNHPRGFLINDKIFSASFLAVLSIIWEHSKKDL